LWLGSIIPAGYEIVVAGIGDPGLLCLDLAWPQSAISPRNKTHLCGAGGNLGGRRNRLFAKSFGVGPSYPRLMIKKPVAEIRGAISRRAMERILTGHAPDLDLVSVDNPVANGAKPFVIE